MGHRNEGDMRYFVLSSIVLIGLAGCADINLRENSETKPTVNAELGEVRPEARPTENEVVEVAAAGTARVGTLGVTIASLDASMPGLWLKTPLVSVAQNGRISFNGKSASVQLLPIDGPATSGSLISLDAMRAIGAPLTGLPEIAVTGV